MQIPDDMAETLEVWDKYFPMPYDDAMAMLSRDMPPGLEVKITLDPDGKGAISVGVYPPETISDERKFDCRTGTINEGMMILAHNERKHGLGRKLMRNEIELFYMSGFKKFEIHAASSAGAYTWARFGFLPTSYGFASKLLTRYGEIAPLLAPGPRKELLKAVKERDVWALADMREDISQRLSTTFKKYADKYADDTPYTNEVVHCATEGRPLPLGKAMLAGLVWDGVLDFDNKTQMQRADAYVGGINLVRAKKPAKQKPTKQRFKP